MTFSAVRNHLYKHLNILYSIGNFATMYFIDYDNLYISFICITYVCSVGRKKRNTILYSPPYFETFHVKWQNPTPHIILPGRGKENNPQFHGNQIHYHRVFSHYYLVLYLIETIPFILFCFIFNRDYSIAWYSWAKK